MDQPVFRFGQDDLRARSREPFFLEREYFPLNHLYGSAEILRQYAGLSPGQPIPWAVQPIMSFQELAGREELLGGGPDVRTSSLARANLPYLFTVGAARERAFRALGTAEVCAIGSMYHYALELYRRQGFDSPAAARRGTIALPDKSDLGKLLDFDRERYAEKLARLPAEFQPVCVSMHWRDFDRGCHEPYLQAGLQVVCSGHPNDIEPLFYHRLHDVCRHFKYSCSNEISTSFALSVLSGCHFFFLDGGPVTIIWNLKNTAYENTTYKGPEPKLDKPSSKTCIEASPFPPAENGWTRQRELAGILTGEKHLKPPEFFHQLSEPARKALSDRLTTVNFPMSPSPAPSEFANWLPAGFDADGWADPNCSLEVPAREGVAGIEIKVTFPPLGQGGQTPVLKFRLDGDEASESQIRVDETTKIIRVALREDGARRKIEFRGPPAVARPGERRARSFRLTAIKWMIDPLPGSKPAATAARDQAASADSSWINKTRAAIARMFERRKRRR